MRKKKYTLEERKASDFYSNRLKSKLKRKDKPIINWAREDFIKWYIKTPKICYYCESTEEKVREFCKKAEHKRIKRGRSLEIDRLLNKKGYSEDNCVLACYCCNNAKSDIFTPEQFKSIGQIISKIIQV